MMSSVIPARLVFQCGHAALVSLPRIKGETNAQRADRVTREKSAAQTRACDFCAQRLEVVVQQAVPAPAAVPIPAAALPSAAVAPVAPEPVVRRNGVSKVKRVEPVVASVQPSVARVEPAAPVEATTPPLQATTPPLQATTPPLQASPPPVQASTPPVEVPTPPAKASKPPVKVKASVPIKASKPPVEPSTPPPAPLPLAEWRAERMAQVKARKVRTPKKVSTPTPKPGIRNGRVARGARFRVEFQVQRVVRAADLHEALRQVQSLGAVEVIAITQEN
jgi:hypothetical protein